MKKSLIIRSFLLIAFLLLGCRDGVKKRVVQNGVVREIVSNGGPTEADLTPDLPADANVVVELVDWRSLRILRPKFDVTVKLNDVGKSLNKLFLNLKLDKKDKVVFLIPNMFEGQPEGESCEDIILDIDSWSRMSGFAKCEFYVDAWGMYCRVRKEFLPVKSESSDLR